MSDGPERTLSERFVTALPFLTLPFLAGLLAFDDGTVLVFGVAYGLALVLTATAVGVYDARRNPGP